ncbi:MAG: isoprenylcysteine carboxylmethyltransferase family protein [Chloroflexi bacterium]|nr:isoprenylcysteine carboxylmethyltransferase family protein [Chloroflexota bacterium]
MSQTFFHSVFVIFFVFFAVIRVYFQWRARLVQGRVEYKESKLNIALRALIGAIFFLGVLFYIVRPQVLAWAELPLPHWLQWLGVALGAISLPLLAWTQLALGSNFSPTLHIRREHTLVTRGPYRYVRHPMYTALFLSLLAILLLTRNWLVGGVPLVGLCVIVLLRVPREESAMIEKFGDAYRQYMKRTGRFLPSVMR